MNKRFGLIVRSTVAYKVSGMVYSTDAFSITPLSTFMFQGSLVTISCTRRGIFKLNNNLNSSDVNLCFSSLIQGGLIFGI